MGIVDAELIGYHKYKSTNSVKTLKVLKVTLHSKTRSSAVAEKRARRICTMRDMCSRVTECFYEMLDLESPLNR